MEALSQNSQGLLTWSLFLLQLLWNSSSISALPATSWCSHGGCGLPMHILTFLGLEVAEGELGGSSVKEAEIGVTGGASSCAPTTASGRHTGDLLSSSSADFERLSDRMYNSPVHVQLHCPLLRVLPAVRPGCEPAAPTGHPSPPTPGTAVHQGHKWLAAAPCHVASDIFVFGNEKLLVLWCTWQSQGSGDLHPALVSVDVWVHFIWEGWEKPACCSLLCPPSPASCLEQRRPSKENFLVSSS